MGSLIKNTISRFGLLPGCTVRGMGYWFGRLTSTHLKVLRVLQIDGHVREQDCEL